MYYPAFGSPGEGFLISDHGEPLYDCVRVSVCVHMCVHACMHARMCVYYMYMLYRYMYGDAPLSKKDRNSKLKITFLI